jgi:hypothetical protein
MGADEIAAQVVAFARRLQQIDPIFAEIALTGAQFDLDGFDSWMRQPLVWDLARDQWRELAPGPYPTTIYCWNRRLPDNGGCKFEIYVNDMRAGNGVTMNDVPSEVNNPQALTGILSALIESFGAAQADVLSAWDMQLHPVWARHWRVWMREGRSLPDDPDNRFKKEQGHYSSAEPWLGGTLYTWPEYEPWRYEGPARS